jgi:hypothetical protein
MNHQPQLLWTLNPHCSPLPANIKNRQINQFCSLAAMAQWDHGWLRSNFQSICEFESGWECKNFTQKVCVTHRLTFAKQQQLNNVDF